MALPWQTLATVDTLEGDLELRRRGDDWLMTIDGRVLMSSFSRKSEEELSRLGVAATRAPKRVLVSGLGMGFTLRALLEVAPATTRVTVVELNAVVVEWCRGPLAVATDNAIGDPRVSVEVADVADVIAKAPAGTFDLILLDLYEGPNSATQGVNDPFYGDAALARTYRALAPGGILGVWSEEQDTRFARRMAGRFTVDKHVIGRGGRHHVVYLGRRA